MAAEVSFDGESASKNGSNVVINRFTCTAPVNIAVVKYWGKQNEELIIPINSSLSVTLDQTHLCAKTTVAVSSSFPDDRLWLNGKEQPIDNPRVERVLNEVRRLARKRQSSSGAPGSESSLGKKVHIYSENINLPTAAGLASSAAGYACLVSALAKAYSVEGNLSTVARLGSGSASRSMFGGFVEWDKGVKNDGSDCIADQIFDESHWPELKVLIMVVSDQRKTTSSASGMQRSVKTSQLIKHRAEVRVPERMENMLEAILDKRFHDFAENTMKESNQFHAVCLDTYPPVFYLNDTSKSIIALVHEYNAHHGTNKRRSDLVPLLPGTASSLVVTGDEAAYTFDAGPNACIMLEEKDMSEFVSLVQHYFPSSTPDNYIQGRPVVTRPIQQSLLDHISIPVSPPDAVKYLISTQSGPGPQSLADPRQHLLNHLGLPHADSRATT